MMVEIIKIVIVPIGAALLHDFLKTASVRQKKKVYFIGIVCVVWLAALSLGFESFF